MTCIVERPNPLDHPIACNGCGWIGVYGEAIAKDTLRCPKCDDTVHGIKHDPHGTVQ
jgi:predicted Zn-ribbon and HTH transcriptional regulator